MSERPDYAVNGDPSVDTWQEACAISQEWADSARRAAAKRHLWRIALVNALLLVTIAILVMLILIVSEVWTP